MARVPDGAVPEPGAAIIGDIAHPATLLANHGGTGTIRWKRLVTGGHMYGAWESFEYARMEPGSTVGRHEHSRTEEVYLVLHGTGLLEVDGVESVLGPGDAAVTRLGSVHAFRPLRDEAVEFLVIETLPPQIVAALPGRTPTVEAPPSAAGPPSSPAVVDMPAAAGPAPVRTVDLDGLQADWRALGTWRLDAGDVLGPRRLEQTEVIAFVVSGTVTAVLPDGDRELGEGSVLALPWGGVLHVENRGGRPAALVVAELGAG